MLAEQPDAVIVATGARYSAGGRSITSTPTFRVTTSASSTGPRTSCLRGARPSGKIVLLDGEGMHASAGVAELLASAGGRGHSM